ncbi:hypothetical protein V6O07_16965, partial [Arthrospira platensis SPKY2]
MGGFSGLAGGAIGSWASGAISSVMVNGIKITSPILQGTIIGSIGGGLGGGLTSFTMSLLSGASFEAALNNSWEAAKIGFVIGTVTGAGGAYANSK